MALTTSEKAKLNKSNRAMQDVDGGDLLDKVSDVEKEDLDAIDAGTAGAATRFQSEALPIVAATTANDTSIVIPDGSVIKNVYVVVATKEDTGSTKTIDIGISGGDEDGFLNGVSVAAAGTIKGTLLNSGQTLGALLCVDEDGSGALVPEPYVCTADTTICYSLGANDFAEMVAEVVVEYLIFE